MLVLDNAEQSSSALVRQQGNDACVGTPLTTQGTLCTLIPGWAEIGTAMLAANARLFFQSESHTTPHRP